MTLYYCDLASDWTDVSGLTGAKQGGPGGFQALIRGTGAAVKLVAGDTLYLKGTAKTTRLVDMTVNGHLWTLGDEVRNNTGSGDDWTGVICEIIDADSLLVELDQGKQYSDVDITDGIENTTAADTDAINTKADFSITWDGNSGDITSGHIALEGRSADYSTKSLVTLDCEDTAGTNVIAGFWCDGGADRIKLSYIWVKNSSIRGFGIPSGVSDYWIFDHCKATLNGTHGWDANGLYKAQFYYCIGTNNGSNGISGLRGGLLFCCRMVDNTGRGITYRDPGPTIVGGLYEGNTEANIRAITGATFGIMVHCVMDASETNSGVEIMTSGVANIVLFCRLTNNAAFGIFVNDSVIDDAAIEDYNVFYGNATRPRENVVAGENSDDNPVDDGYESSTNFNIKVGAEIRSAEVDLYWDI